MRPLVINDHNKIETVYNESVQYLKNNSLIHNDIGDFLWAYNEIGTLIPQTTDNFWSGHFFPFAESYYELENSFQFCMQGFYRHSLSTLRSVLELAVVGLYFDKADQAHLDIQEWFHSIDPTPFFKNTLDELFKLERFKHANLRTNVLDEVKGLYDTLSNYVHVRGYRFSTTGASRSNFNQFNEKALVLYVQLMKRVVTYAVTLIILKYPIGMQYLPLWQKFGLNTPIGGLLDEAYQNAIFKVLDEKTKEILQNISDNDPIVQEIIRSINEMPDVTEEELKKQNENFEKTIEEHRYRSPDTT